MRRVLLIAAVLGLLLMFLVSIQLIGDAFKLFGKDLAAQVLEFTSHPLAGLFIGVFATSVVQSSSTTTSIVVGLVGAGQLSVTSAVPMIMGANIGTSVTNTLVSMGHISRGTEFRRAFAAATVHDFFNLLSVAILFPLQWSTGFLGHMAKFIAGIVTGGADLKFQSPLKAVIKPIAHVFKESASAVSDAHQVQATLLVVVAAIMLFLALKYLTRLLRGAVVEKASSFFERTLFRTPILAFLVGLALTAVVQSSSVTTSLAVPLAGAGVLTLMQIYPYTLGANVGTTITALLASLAATENFEAAVAVALSHLLFNLIGIAMITPWRPLRMVPPRLATLLADLSVERRWVPVVYVVVVFFVIPGILILISR